MSAPNTSGQPRLDPIFDAAEHLLTGNPFTGGWMRGRSRQKALQRFLVRGPAWEGEEGGLRIVFMNFAHQDDVDPFIRCRSKHSIWNCPPDVFEGLTAFFPLGEQDIRFRYGTGTMRATIDRYRRLFVRGFVDRIIDHIRPNVVIVPTDLNFWLRPIVEEFRVRGIKAMVQVADGGLTYEDFGSERRDIAECYPPIADRYYFWNERQARCYQDVGVDSYRMAVMGQPRSDTLFHSERWPSRHQSGLPDVGKIVLFFAHDRINFQGVDMTATQWNAFREETNRALLTVAKTVPSCNVVVALSPGQMDGREVVTQFEKRKLKNTLVVADVAQAQRLIVHADIIVGSQAPSMVEAMLTSKPIIYAGWDIDQYASPGALLPIHMSGGCALAQSPDHLFRLVLKALAGDLQPDEITQRYRKALTDYFYYNADARVASRILDDMSTFAR